MPGPVGVGHCVYAGPRWGRLLCVCRAPVGVGHCVYAGPPLNGLFKGSFFDVYCVYNSILFLFFVI